MIHIYPRSCRLINCPPPPFLHFPIFPAVKICTWHASSKDNSHRKGKLPWSATVKCVTVYTDVRYITNKNDITWLSFPRIRDFFFFKQKKKIMGGKVRQGILFVSSVINSDVSSYWGCLVFLFGSGRWTVSNTVLAGHCFWLPLGQWPQEISWRPKTQRPKTLFCFHVVLVVTDNSLVDRTGIEMARRTQVLKIRQAKVGCIEPEIASITT